MALRGLLLSSCQGHCCECDVRSRAVRYVADFPYCFAVDVSNVFSHGFVVGWRIHVDTVEVRCAFRVAVLLRHERGDAVDVTRL